MKRLCEILTYKRRHESTSEKAFLDRFIVPIPSIQQDKFGNYYLLQGEDPETIFSCHVDTMHNGDGRQKIVFDSIKREIFKEEKDCLGADNGAGVWILLNLLEAKVPGLYLFHRGEERGGLGSRWIKENTPDLVKGYKRAIAFDRRDKCSVITHQRGGQRCCSDEFGRALIAQLGLNQNLDTTGAFTDTANYTELVPECTNISVGYMNEHTAMEYLFMDYVQNLRDAVLKVNWTALPTVRDPARKQYTNNYHGYRQADFYTNDEDWDYPDAAPQPPKKTQTNIDKDVDTVLEAIYNRHRSVTHFPDKTKATPHTPIVWKDLLAITQGSPFLAADLLRALEVTYAELNNPKLLRKHRKKRRKVFSGRVKEGSYLAQPGLKKTIAQAIKDLPATPLHREVSPGPDTSHVLLNPPALPKPHIVGPAGSLSDKNSPDSL